MSSGSSKRDNNSKENAARDLSFLKDFGQAVIRSTPTSGLSLPTRLLCLPIQNRMVFPGLMAPLYIANQTYIDTINKIIADHGMIGLVIPREDWNASRSQIFEKDIFRHGVAIKVLKKVNMPDEGSHLLVQGIRRFRIEKVLEEGQFLYANVQYLEDTMVKDQETEALTRALIYQVKELAETQPLFSEEMRLALVNTHHPGELVDLVAYTIAFPRGKLNRYLSVSSVKKRLSFVLVELKREYELLELQKKIQSEVSEKVTKAQREFFLREQLNLIQEELGVKKNDQSKLIKRFRDRMEELVLSKEVKIQLTEDIDRLESMNEMTPEYQVIRNYLEYTLFLPWGITTDDNANMDKARQILNKTHHGLVRPKTRIMEFLAVRKLNPDYRGGILCFVGPPGCGKTSLGESIAKALNRKFFRFSLGGMRDEAEIKGHRRTYIGAMPGKVVQALKRVGTQNPVLLMDEVDKMGTSFQGDPAAALLEVLDPEQNQTFLDHYVDLSFDLGKVLFILTANVLENIPEPLADRMEVIELSGYNEVEKFHIARKHLIPKLMKKHGLRPSQFAIPDPMLKFLIEEYAREAGVRYLDQCLATLMRHKAVELTSETRIKHPLKWNRQSFIKILGPSQFRDGRVKKITRSGIAYGLAWTSLGGEVLTIETLSLPNKNKKENFHMTGQIGEVMSESAQLAYSYASKYATRYGASDKFFESHEIHIHIPAGAVPKDGPSAGIVLLCALISLASNKVMPGDLAMTGEISLSGDVLPIGGIKEKLLAARREGIKRVMMPKANQSDVENLEKENLKGLKIFYVQRVNEVLTYLFGEKVAHLKSQTQSHSGSKIAAKGEGEKSKTSRSSIYPPTQ
jgi:ATP-dependent Lon protease